MTIEQFLAWQTELMNAFGWFIRWWLILFAAGGVFAAFFVFMLNLISNWLERS